MTTGPDRTATVEVLTAEVRTLMVGNRQVTLSVYRQLDSVSFKRIDPFGRVSAKEKPHRNAWGEIEEDVAIRVVGRDRQTGALIRSALTIRQYSEYELSRATDEERAAINQRQDAACAWASLPLIVLAGLR